MQAKERRLARFKVELEDKMPSSFDSAGHRGTNMSVKSVLEKRKLVGDHSMEAASELPNGSSTSDYEGLESTVIVGLCPDMCPGINTIHFTSKPELVLFWNCWISGRFISHIDQKKDGSSEFSLFQKLLVTLDY